jgi:transposase
MASFGSCAQVLPGATCRCPYGPRTTCYNRFVRWRQAGVWDRIMDALAAGHDAAVQMIDTSVVRVHQNGACIAGNNHQDIGRSRGGLTSKIHAVVDTNGLPVHLALTPGEAHDNRLCSVLLSPLLPQTMLLADHGYDADWIRELARQQGAWIPPKRNRKDPICLAPICIVRAANYLAFVKLASIRVWLHANESAPQASVREDARSRQAALKPVSSRLSARRRLRAAGS